MKQKQLLKPLFLLCALLVGGLNSVWAQDEAITFDFEADGAHRNGTNNSYSGTNVYSQNGANITLTYADAVTTGTPINGSANILGRIAKNTTNVITVVIGPINIVDKTITAISYKIKGQTTVGVTMAYSTDGKSYSNLQSCGIGSLSPSAVSTKEVTNQNITGDNFYLRFTSNVSSSTTSNRDIQLDDIVITYQTNSASDTRTATTTTIDDTGITNKNKFVGTSAGSLSASVVAGETSITNATVTWSGSDDAVATIDALNGAVTLVGAGTVTFTASYAGDETNYKPSSATYEMIVTNIDPNTPGTETSPYTVAQARAAIDAGTGMTGVYVKGTVSEIVTAYNSQYGNISYNISADGTTTSDQLQAYRGKSYNGENFTSENDIKVGDVVVVYGNLKKHNDIYEFDANNQLVSLNRPTNPIITASDVELEYDATSGEVAYEVANAVASVSLDATTDADWISNITVSDDKVTFTTTVNEGSTDRTATITLSYTGATDKAITVTQAHFVADYATLPFEYNDGKPSNISGLTQSGLGTDYKASPKMKFDGTGDYLVLKINEAPGKLTFDIKGNDFSGGTFTLQASADGETYTDVTTYTELGDTQNEFITTLASNVRYIKWIYTKKSLGNVGLGNIKLDKPITVSISSVGYKAYNTTTDTDFSGTGVKAYVVTGYTTESVTLTEVTAVPADIPLVLKADGGDYTLKAAEETPAAPAKNLLQVSNGTVGDGATIYALANVKDSPDSPDSPGFYVVKSGLTIPTNYIVIPAGNAPALSFDFGEGTTGIRSIENGQLTIDNVYYDLSGRKLNAMPTQKGVYIVNGKKVVIK